MSKSSFSEAEQPVLLAQVTPAWATGRAAVEYQRHSGRWGGYDWADGDSGGDRPAQNLPKNL